MRLVIRDSNAPAWAREAFDGPAEVKEDPAPPAEPPEVEKPIEPEKPVRSEEPVESEEPTEPNKPADVPENGTGEKADG